MIIPVGHKRKVVKKWGGKKNIELRKNVEQFYSRENCNIV